MQTYRSPGWLPGGNLQTIWPALYSTRFLGDSPVYKRERWTTPDQDFIDVDWLERDAPGQTLLVLFHGLEGSSGSAYALAFADFARRRGLSYAVPHFRGCSGEINLAPRAYHSGDFQEIDWILRRMRERHVGSIVVVGISLGGNAVMRWAEMMGASAGEVVDAVASVSSPLDLTASGFHIGRGFNRLVYTPMFLRTMKPKALTKLEQFPGLFDRDRMVASKNLYEFDDVFTGPLHGFTGTDDYWGRASAKPHLNDIKIPALALNAKNDPFIPAWSLPQPGSTPPNLTLWQPEHGGHVGFAFGNFPANVREMPQAVGDWLLGHVSSNRSGDIHG